MEPADGLFNGGIIDHNAPMIPELAELSRLSSVIGNDHRRVQGPGGNTSLKVDGTLWIKASGKWLAHAGREQVFVPVDLAALRRAMAEGKIDPVSDATRDDGATGLRPSIETSFHAALNQSVVLHTHSVATIAFAVRKDAADVLADRLKGLDWVLIPYARPGMPLTTAMIAAMDGRRPNVFVLANHGLVVCGDDCASAMALMIEVDRRLAAPERASPEPDLPGLAALATGTNYFLPADASVHRLGCETVSERIALAGTLYPDHVVFLGPGTTVIDPDASVVSRPDVLRAAPALLVVRGKGVLLQAGLSAAAIAMVRCLSDVVAHIPIDAPVRYLTSADEAVLMNWEAEHARKALNQQNSDIAGTR